jgi:D-alanyl-D-alanine carboxypeptidase (penicillin-binding protein 5/6)
MKTIILLALALMLSAASPLAAAEKPGHAKPPAAAAPKSEGKAGQSVGKPIAPVESEGVNAAGFPTIETAAQFAYIVDMGTGAILLDKNGDERMTPSSMTKMMTAYIVFDKLQKGELQLTDTFPVSENAWRRGGAVTDGSTMFLELGSRATVQDLIQGVVVQSGNDACIVLAEGLSGSEDAFAEEMNKRAKQMGMTGTNFRNSSGYPDIDHYSTPHDLALLAIHSIMDHPEYYKYYSELSFTYNGHNQGNRNLLLTRGIGVDGLKTGHTEAAGFGQTISAIRGGRRVVLVVNGLHSMKERAEESERLIDWAYRAFDDYKLFKAGDVVEQADVWLGEAKTVPLVTTNQVTVTLPRRSSRDMVVKVAYDGPIAAPIAKGQPIAKLKITAAGVAPVELPLVAGADVPQLGAFGRASAALAYMVSGKK